MSLKRYVWCVLILFLYVRPSDNCCEVIKRIARCASNTSFPLNEEVNIRKLFLDNNNIVKIVSKNDLEKFTELEEISFVNSNIEKIDPQAFIHNTKLKLLDLSHNRNFKFNDNWLESNSIEKLLMERTGLRKIPPLFFSQMKNLTIIDLGDNQDLYYEGHMHALREALKELPKLNTLIFNRGDADKIVINNLCNFTIVKDILLTYYDRKDNRLHDTIKCNKDNLIPKSNPEKSYGSITTTNYFTYLIILVGIQGICRSGN